MSPSGFGDRAACGPRPHDRTGDRTVDVTGDRRATARERLAPPLPTTERTW